MASLTVPTSPVADSRGSTSSGAVQRWASSARRLRWKSGYPAKPSLATSRSTVGALAADCSATTVSGSRPVNG